MEPFQSLNAATVAGAGSVLDLESPVADFTLWVLNTSGNAQVALEGSPDGTNWANIGPGGAGFSAGFAAVSFGPRTPSTVVVWCRYVRVRFTGINSGSPVVSAWITAARPDGSE